MKKIIALLLVLIMVVSLAALTGCGKSVPEDFKVGVIHIGNPSDGAGYSFAHDQGIIAMQKNLGLSDSQIIRKVNIADGDAAATKTAMEECIEAGAKIIFGTSWGYMETMAELAAAFPDVVFSHGSGYMSNDTNFNNYFGRIYQARYLSGIAAGLKTQSDKIGFVAAMDITNSEVTGGLNAFARGVASVNPDAEVYVKVTNTWFSVDLENQAAEALLDLGCDVIAQHCDTTAPQLAAEKRGVWSCGYNSDMTADAPAAHLTAPIWNWGVYYTAAVQAVLDGKWAEFGNYFGGIAEGFVDISPLSANCAEGTQAITDSVKALIKDGSFGVFDGKQVKVDGTTVSLIDEALMDNKGNTIVEAGGACLEDSVITGGINWYYANVIEA